MEILIGASKTFMEIDGIGSPKAKRAEIFTRKYGDDCISVFRRIFRTNIHTHKPNFASTLAKQEFLCPGSLDEITKNKSNRRMFSFIHIRVRIVVHAEVLYTYLISLGTINLNWFVYNGCYEFILTSMSKKN